VGLAVTPPTPERSLRGLDRLLKSTVLLKRDAIVVERSVSLEEIANGHGPQLEFMQRAAELDDKGTFLNKRIIAQCSRRAAKTTGICGLMAIDASERNGYQIYFGLNKSAVRTAIWERVWRPICDKHFKGKCVHLDGSMITRFATGAVVAFTGTDDVGHIGNYLGSGLRRVVVDEAQEQRQSVLIPLIRRILPPALVDVGGQMILAGTIAEVPAGIFYDIWMTGEGWLKRNWNMFQNPHMTDQMERLEEELRSSKQLITDPLIRREWFGEFIFDASVTAYKYNVTRNGYTPEEPEWLEKFLKKHDGDPYFEHIHRTQRPNDGTARYGLMAAKPFPGIDTFSCAIDPGSRDRFSIVVNGWGSGTPQVQQVFEFSSKRKAHLNWSHLDPMRRLIEKVYGPVFWFYDAGGSKVVLDSFIGDTGLPALLPAAKSGLRGQVERVSDLLILSLYKVMIGSAMEEDFQKTRWDPDARAKLQWKWASTWHPDPAETSRYSLGAYFDVFEPPAEPKDREQTEREAHELAMRRRSAARTGNVLEEDLDAHYTGEAEAETQWD
jgi:hypothetical protein